MIRRQAHTLSFIVFVGIFSLISTDCTAPRVSTSDGRGIIVSVEQIDTLQSWTSPLFGHHAHKMVTIDDTSLVAIQFMGPYPIADNVLVKRTERGQWEPLARITGTYTPGVLLSDVDGGVNLFCNSQTEPIKHYRMSREHRTRIDTVAVGNGLEDGRGWYIGAGMTGDTVFMAYVTLTYDLFLTWKRVHEARWNSPILIHRGTVDAVIGNHSWTRPYFAFHDGMGYFIVNETSDGSVRNTYNGVVLVSFPVERPSDFSTEFVDEVPLGYTSFNTDFSISSDGDLVVVYSRGSQVYESGKMHTRPEPGIYCAVRTLGSPTWNRSRIFDDHREGSIIMNDRTGIDIVQLLPTAIIDSLSGKPLRWRASRSIDHGVHWDAIPIEYHGQSFSGSTHLEIGIRQMNGSSVTWGMFDDLIRTDTRTGLRDYRLYAVKFERQQSK